LKPIITVGIFRLVPHNVVVDDLHACGCQ